MVDYQYKNVNGENIKLTDAEIKELQDRDTAYAAKSGERKLAEIKDIRTLKLQATDYMANSDVTMPDYIKTWRQTLRDLPQNNTTESQYDTLLERNSDGSLKNSIWTQPTE
mgnify:CR=1 FL=1|tara:strand:- start:19 stop:351 length:333 start_codon:yes stop_codon:yes gene_type:complete